MIFLLIALMLTAVFLIAQRTVDDPVKQLLAAGDHEVPVPDSAQVWWAESMQCLGESPKPMPAIRYFEGPTIPPSWNCRATEQNPTGSFKGCTASNGRVILFGWTYSTHRDIASHELWHVRHGGGHPASVFSPPRCGLAPA